MNDERLDHAIRRHVISVLIAHQWRRKETARALGIGRTTLYRLLAKWRKKYMERAFDLTGGTNG